MNRRQRRANTARMRERYGVSPTAADWTGAERVVSVLVALREAFADVEGACFVTAATGAAAMVGLGLDARPCLGMAYFHRSPVCCAHGWIEWAGDVYDVAIERPLLPAMSLPPVVGGMHSLHPVGIDDEWPLLLDYVRGELDEMTEPIAAMGVWAYLDEAPREIASRVGQAALGAGVDLAKVRREHPDLAWSV